MNSTKLEEGNLLIRELLYHFSCLAVIAKLISKGWTRYWKRKLKKKRSITLYGITSLKRAQTVRNVTKSDLK
jgi:hypothetical protein